MGLKMFGNCWNAPLEVLPILWQPIFSPLWNWFPFCRNYFLFPSELIPILSRLLLVPFGIDSHSVTTYMYFLSHWGLISHSVKVTSCPLPIWFPFCHDPLIDYGTFEMFLSQLTTEIEIFHYTPWKCRISFENLVNWGGVDIRYK